MRNGQWLKVLLTINAVLMTALMVVIVFSGLGPNSAAGAPPFTPGIPDAGAQREQIIGELQTIRKAVKANTALLLTGELSVEVSNLDEIESDQEPQ